MSLHIFTWGYSRDRTFQDLIAALPEDRRKPGTIAIIDIRRSRWPSRNPAWGCRDSQYDLAAFEPCYGIPSPNLPWGPYYGWLWELGNDQSGPAGQWTAIACAELLEQAMGVAIEQLYQRGAIVLVCAESNPSPGTKRQCHRVAVANALAAEVERRTGTRPEVVHL